MRKPTNRESKDSFNLDTAYKRFENTGLNQDDDLNNGTFVSMNRTTEFNHPGNTSIF